MPSQTPSDTFVTDCELILFGKDVKPVDRSGRKGYVIACNDSSVSINGIIFFNRNVAPPQRVVPIDSSIETKAAVLESAIHRLRPAWDQKTGNVTIDGKTHAPGETFRLSVPEYGTSVSVNVAPHALGVQYEDQSVGVMPGVAEPVNPVKATFDYVLKELHVRALVVMGKGYSYTFPQSEASRVRASLAKIPTTAEFLSVDEYGRKHYKPLTIDGLMWDSAVISDFVEASQK
jgi:hypothetical protein